MKKIELDVIIDTPENEIDMQYGLETLKGTSDVVTLVSEAVLEGTIAKTGRRTVGSKNLRTKLKRSFKGSFGQRFSIEIEDNRLVTKLRKMGDDVFVEVVSYFIMEALYLDAGELTAEASAVLDGLEGVAENLFRRIDTPLKEMHKISRNYNYDVKLRHRKRGHETKQLVKLTSETSSYLTDSTIDENIEELEVVIVRYHSKTGNGRLHIKGHDEFYSFGYGTNLAQVKRALRKKISENLHINNTMHPENGTFIRVRVKKKVLPTGAVIKYLILGVLE